MLAEFKVKNFKNFSTELHLDLSRSNNYEFNEQAVKNGIIKTALIYGKNGSGKTNLGYAVFDIILHLVDKEKDLEEYRPYENLTIGGKVSFYYKFIFEDGILEYIYEKGAPQTLLIEKVMINGVEVIAYDYEKHEGKVTLKGAETLNTDLSEKNISFVKYIYSNTVLVDDMNNQIFNLFIQFVENMLLFSSLERNNYQGFMTGSESVAEGIIKNGKVKEFENFLRESGIEYNLIEKEIDGSKRLYCKFGNKEVNFYKIASKGTTSLALFYYWLIQLDKVSLVFIDEFDAFYHNTLAARVVKEVLNLKNTQGLFTTHNTDIMTNDLLRPDCYLQIVGGSIKSFSDSTPKELRKAHNLQKMYKAGAFTE